MKYDLEFGIDKQELMVSYLLADEAVYQRASSILETKYFDQELQPAVDYILYHTDKFNALPNSDQIYAETGKKIDVAKMTTQDSEWALSNIEKFCQRQAIVHAVNDSLSFIDEGNYGEVESKVKLALEVSLEKDIGTNIFLNPRELMDRIRQNKTVASGWKQFDEVLYGGLNRGEITIFAAGSGVGKSLALQNLGLNWFYGTQYELKNGDTKTFAPMHVVYISFELSEELIARRMYTMIADIPSYDIFKRMNDVETRVAIDAKKGGSYTVKYMSSGTTTNQLRAYLKEYEVKEGHKPDALLIDYLDLMSPNNKKIDVTNSFAKDKFISEELRSLAAEYDVLMATASQLNRGSVDEADHNHAMISGGISKIQTADNVVSIYCSPAMRERGEYQLQFLKTRSSNGTHRKITLLLNTESLRLTNNDEDDDNPIMSVEEAKSSIFGASASSSGIGLNIGSPPIDQQATHKSPVSDMLKMKNATNGSPPELDKATQPQNDGELLPPMERMRRILNAKNK